MKHSQKFLQRRKLLMMLPLLVLPFITMMFWALGGGQGSPVQAKSLETTGLNLDLPDAKFQDKEIWDKLSLYEIAERDSAKFEDARESDPYFDLVTFQSMQEKQAKTEAELQSNLIDSFPARDRLAIDENEERVNRKLEELISEINKPTPAESFASSEDPAVTSSDPQFSSDVEKLEQMMEMINDNNASDPEMAQIGEVLEKILDIQHPKRVMEKMKAKSQKEKESVFEVKSHKSTDDITLLGVAGVAAPQTEEKFTFDHSSLIPARQNSFYGLGDEVLQVERQDENSFEAVIHDTQELVAGATVKMRLLNDIYINGNHIPRNQFVFGVCSINGERLTIEVGSIRTGNSLLPISLTVYDMDGLEGIYIPGAITRDAAKQASDDAMQNIQLMSLDPSIGAQVASAGIEATKGLLSKKAKLVKITVKSGYRILLKDTKFE